MPMIFSLAEVIASALLRWNGSPCLSAQFASTDVSGGGVRKCKKTDLFPGVRARVDDDGFDVYCYIVPAVTLGDFVSQFTLDLLAVRSRAHRFASSLGSNSIP